MIVFQIHCNFFIVLPIRLKTYRSNVFLFFIRQIGRAQKLGPNSSRPVWRCLWEKLTYFKKSISFFGWFVWSSFEKLEWVERITKIFIIIVIAAKTAITFWIIIFYHYPITAVHPVKCQAQPYSQELPSAVLANWHNDSATAEPVNNGELGASAIQHDITSEKSLRYYGPKIWNSLLFHGKILKVSKTLLKIGMVVHRVHSSCRVCQSWTELILSFTSPAPVNTLHTTHKILAQPICF